MAVYSSKQVQYLPLLPGRLQATLQHYFPKGVLKLHRLYNRYSSSLLMMKH
uniref:Uncharacterized protein n=1 Tax=Arundo donax TaxID=35708 RepID=A0A0A9E3A3_ARUDO